jgi:hypothetical protein
MSSISRCNSRATPAWRLKANRSLRPLKNGPFVQHARDVTGGAYERAERRQNVDECGTGGPD